jgi:hypothetical protein
MQEEATDEENSSGGDLNSHGDSPCCSGRRVHVLVDTIVDPEADQRTGLVCDFEETGEDTADRNDGEFGDVAGDCGSDGTACDTGESAASVWRC